jgi:hypothetical protein
LVNGQGYVISSLQALNRSYAGDYAET